MQRLQLTHRLFVQFFGVRRLMEVEVAAEHFVRTFAGKHHFDAHGFNFPRHQVHRRRSANSGHIVGFDVIDNVADGIQPFLDGKVNFVVHSAEVVGHLLRRFQVRRAFQTDRERVQLRPPGFATLLIFDATGGEFLGDSRDDR